MIKVSEIVEKNIKKSPFLEEALSRGILNLSALARMIKPDVEKGVRLLSSSCDLILMTNLLFECDDKKTVMEEGKRVLREGGRILVVDWKEDAPLGPEEGRISAEKLKEVAEELNLKLEKEFNAGIYHYGLVFLK